MKYLFYLLLLITLNIQLHTKSITPNLKTKIDSLEMELSHLKIRGDTNEVKLLFELSSTYRVTNPTNGIKYGMMALGTLWGCLL